MHWFTGANDDGSGGSYNALRDAKAGEARYQAKGFRTSHEYPANTGHGLSGRFGGIVGQQLALYDKGTVTTPTPTPTKSPTASPSPTKSPTATPSPTKSPTATPSPTKSPTAPSTSWAHQIVPSRTGAALTVNVPSGTERTTFRVSRYEFGTQTGFYVYTTRTGTGTELTLSTSLSPGIAYNYQVESGRDRNVVASGSFRTSP
jgi:hypothetical protein